jgi:cob(I)alamin adenosyltransferase
MFKGYVQVYTGDGKGKTTAAVGLAVRAAGSGLKVFFAQFIKGKESSEFKALKRFDEDIRFKLYGKGFVFGNPSREDILAAREGIDECSAAMSCGLYQVVILDEINVALRYGLITLEDVLGLIDAKPEDVELVLTGRYAHEKVIERADLVTEAKEVKHYYKLGIAARAGIEY